MKNLSAMFLLMLCLIVLSACSSILSAKKTSNQLPKASPGVYVNQEYRFSVTYPKAWMEDSDIRGPDTVFQISEPMKIGTLSVSISSKGELDLIRVPHFFPGAMQAIFPNSDGYEILSKKEITLDCGTDAVEFEMDWLWEDGHTSLKSTFTIAYKANKLITVSTTSWHPEVPSLKKIHRSFKFY